jgi:kumamolisin
MNEIPGRAPGSGDAASSSQAARSLGPLDPDERIEVSIRVRPRSPVDLARIEEQATLPPADRHYPSRQEYAAAHGADPADLAKVEAFAREQGLTVEDSSPGRRTVTLSGPSAAFAAAFGTGLCRRATDRGTFHTPTGPIVVPAELRPIIEAVVGLDTEPHARPHAADAHEGRETTPDINL